MSGVDLKKISAPELVKLKYDLAVDLYRQRARALEVEAASKKEWIPYLVYKVFGPEIIPSIALTLNPRWSIDPKVREFANKRVPGIYPPQTVSVNRTRTRTSQWSRVIKTKYTVYGVINGSHLEWGGDHWTFPMNPTTYFPTNGTVYYTCGTQIPYEDFVKDTTWKSRNPQVAKMPKDLPTRRALQLNERGEFEQLDCTFKSPSNSTSWTSTDYSWNDFWSPSLFNSNVGTYTVAFENGSASVDSTIIPAVAVTERNIAIEAMETLADKLIAQCLPSRRKYNALYQIGELKDLPQLIRGSLSAWKDVESLMGGGAAFVKALSSPKFWTRQKILELRDSLAKCKVFLDPDKSAGSAYLTYKFGWESMYQAVDQLVHAPSKISKEINYLLDRNGRDATLSTIWHLPPSVEASSVVTPYVGYPMLPDPQDPLYQRTTREASIRCVVNSGVVLPPLDVPTLRQVLYAGKLGLTPRPSDLWNLIPFTWLVDWFAGVSDYLRIIEEVQLDKSLINWGMMTYKSKMSSYASIGGFMLYNDFTHNASGSVYSLAEHKALLRGEGLFTANYTLRVGIETLSQVKLSSGLRLSDTQKKILLALTTSWGNPSARRVSSP
jgi:hypothetical protein